MSREAEGDRQQTPPRHDVAGGGTLGWLHRIAGFVLGLGLWVFGLLGFVNRLEFFATSGPPVLGLSSNGLLSAISVVFGTILIVAAVRGGRLASTTSVVVGALFMASGVLNVLVLATPFNVLSFRMSNVVFSLVAGALLLVLGAYGRFTGRLPDSSPYHRVAHGGPVDAQHSSDNDQQTPTDRADATAARELAEAERASAGGGGTAEQRDILSQVGGSRDAAGRRAIWRRLTE
ncbi:DUF4383 domain-containing protein [Pseudonocardia sp. KRD291]|uniref:DUF4383 domain-containing protein n=1 Tax=Pseudonocardia sp. KRD291 TaxID=2792007 RepID=UPI001C4A6130|nr:DUF4383 domain-containing protein [Pseudonocardia sp. KRD291]MBW0100849.1 DUF4383 domain-containing protein [Pseudonocardia sp. KRD291]